MSRDPKHAPATAFVTGAASGIGRRCVMRLAAMGTQVFATDVDDAGLERAASEDGWRDRGVRLARLDVRDAAAWEERYAQAISELGAIDLHMNVAGVLAPAWVHEISAKDVDFMVDVNLKGVIHGTVRATRHMVQRGRGHVVNVASLAALAPVPGLSIYAATKYAVRGFSLSAAIELREKGVAVTTVCPDAVDTPMLHLQETYDEASLTFSGRSKPLTADDVAEVMCGRVLEQRPLEIAIPFERGALAKVANLLPQSSAVLLPLLRARGRKQRLGRKA
jgi:3-oxoacyl-[acyl-carrier protein] reductase